MKATPKTKHPYGARVQLATLVEIQNLLFTIHNELSLTLDDEDIFTALRTINKRMAAYVDLAQKSPSHSLGRGDIEGLGLPDRI